MKIKKKQEREDLKIAFNYDAGNYDNYRWRNSFAARSDFKNTKERLILFLNCQKTDSILEVGCGEGTWTELIAPLCREYDAIDISGEMLKIAKKRKGCEGINFFHTTFESFNTNKQYDKIFMVRVFEYMKDKNKMLKKIYKLLKPGGKIVIVTKAFPSIWCGRVRLMEFIKKLKHKNNDYIRNKNRNKKVIPKLWHKRINYITIKNILSKIGFVSTSISIIDVRPLIFIGGANEYPFVPLRYQEKLSTLCNKLSKRIISFPPMFQFLLLPLSEMCIISASKGIKK